MRDMVDAGQLKDITKSVDASVKQNIGSALDATTVDGKIYGVPYTVTPGGIWYSKDLFAKAGITDTPTTWDELKSDINKLKNAGITPVALGPLCVSARQTCSVKRWTARSSMINAGPKLAKM